MEGKKYDEGKPRTDLLPFKALTEVSKVLALGANQYGEWNWARGMNWSRLLGAALRHLFAWGGKENIDPDSGLSHIAHAATCCLFLLEYELRQQGKDNRHEWSERELSVSECGAMNALNLSLEDIKEIYAKERENKYIHEAKKVKNPFHPTLGRSDT